MPVAEAGARVEDRANRRWFKRLPDTHRSTNSQAFSLDRNHVGLEFANSAAVMQMINDQPQQSAVAASPWQGRRDDAVQRETAQFLSRLDFRHISSHINQRKPGYYLILLRSEIRHRSLRDKPTFNE
jgi:hypothetical protein